MNDTSVGTVSRAAVVAVVEVIAVALAAYAGFVAFVFLPPGLGGGSQGSAGRSLLGIVALLFSIVLPTTGFLCAAWFWRQSVWLYRAAGAAGVMVVIWVLLFAVFPR